MKAEKHNISYLQPMQSYTEFPVALDMCKQVLPLKGGKIVVNYAERYSSIIAQIQKFSVWW